MLPPAWVGTVQGLVVLPHTTLVLARPQDLAKRVRTIDLEGPLKPPFYGGSGAWPSRACPVSGGWLGTGVGGR